MSLTTARQSVEDTTYVSTLSVDREKTVNTKRLDIPLLILSLTLTLLILAPRSALSQGSIYGVLQNDDLSIPPDDAIRFIGFIGDTDNEVRIQSCIGAAYEGGNWYDDFQNYQGESPGLPYLYLFFNLLDQQAGTVAEMIPDNSFEQQDVTLAPVAFPAPVANLQANRHNGTAVLVHWDSEPDLTWHVYRRLGASEGSLFRIDNPAGQLTDPGVGTPEFLDTDVLDGECYSYMVVAESSGNGYSPPSAVVEIDLSTCCEGLVGNVNMSAGDAPTIGDVSLLIDHLFISFTEPVCLPEADVNQSGGAEPTRLDISIGDISLLIDHLFINFVPIPYCTDVL